METGLRCAAFSGARERERRRRDVAAAVQRGFSRTRRLPACCVAAVKVRRAATVPAGRFGAAEEVAQLVTFLASDASRCIVAADIVIDGGLSKIRL